jgi:uridine phosphorylase
MASDEYPILEFDPSTKAVIEPANVVEARDAPEHGVICFFGDVVKSLTTEQSCRQLRSFRTVLGPLRAYEVQRSGRRVAVFLPGITAPLAAGLTDEMIARGCRKLIACGSAGVLDETLERGCLVVPTRAVRDEGTSYHYAPPSREIEAHPDAVAAIQTTLDEWYVPYVMGKTWTTDAFYRETPGRVRRRKAEGCLAVEMEAAALFALAQFRKVPLGYILWAGDDVSGAQWDSRDQYDVAMSRERVLELAIEACQRL